MFLLATFGVNSKRFGEFAHIPESVQHRSTRKCTTQSPCVDLSAYMSFSEFNINVLT